MACDGHYSEAMLPTEQKNNYYSKVLQTIQVRPRSLCKRGMAIVLGKVTAYTTEDGYFSDAMLPLQPTDGHYCEEVQPMPQRDVHYFQIFTSSLQNKDERTEKKVAVKEPCWWWWLFSSYVRSWKKVPRVIPRLCWHTQIPFFKSGVVSTVAQRAETTVNFFCPDELCENSFP